MFALVLGEEPYVSIVVSYSSVYEILRNYMFKLTFTYIYIEAVDGWHSSFEETQLGKRKMPTSYGPRDNVMEADVHGCPQNKSLHRRN